MLGNFKELYVNFYEENSDVRQEGFSTSCTLRPKECITVNNCGSHNVCVCPHHQNTKLMVPAVNKPLCYKDLTTLLACDTANEDCMLKWWHSDNLRKQISNIFLENYVSGDDIFYTQRENTVRTNTNLSELQFQDFIDELVKKLLKLTAHHFI